MDYDGQTIVIEPVLTDWSQLAFWLIAIAALVVALIILLVIRHLAGKRRHQATTRKVATIMLWTMTAILALNILGLRAYVDDKVNETAMEVRGNQVSELMELSRAAQVIVSPGDQAAGPNKFRMTFNGTTWLFGTLPWTSKDTYEIAVIPEG